MSVVIKWIGYFGTPDMIPNLFLLFSGVDYLQFFLPFMPKLEVHMCITLRNLART